MTIDRVHQAIRLADTSVRMYRKRNGNVSLRLRSYLMVLTKGTGFRLSAYLDDISCALTLASGQVVSFDTISFTDDCLYEMDTMVHGFWASGETKMDVMKDTVGRFRMEYKLFYHPSLGPPPSFELIVPVVRRGPYSQAILK